MFVKGGALYAVESGAEPKVARLPIRRCTGPACPCTKCPALRANPPYCSGLHSWLIVPLPGILDG